MKLISLNIYGGRIMFKLPDFFNAQQADIICMQEVNDIAGETGGVFESLDMLQKKCEFSEKFMAADLSFHYQNRDASYGIAILSNLPLSDKDVVFVQGEYCHDYDDNEADGDHPRNFQHSVVQANGRPVHIINFHGAFVRGTKEGNADTLQHVQAIADYAERFSDEPTIITGDFNLAPESESMQILNRRFRNLPVEYGVRSTYSPVLHVYDVICDYVYVSKHVIVNSFAVTDDIVSDHKPLVLEFDV